MSEDTKEALQIEVKKTSMQILSELFSTFDAEPPVIVKKEKKDKKDKKDSEKSKKKHKKDKKHKKKSKKRRKSSSSDSSSSSDESELDLAKILIKQEKDLAEKKIKIEGTSLTLDLADLKQEIIKRESDLKDTKPSIAELEAKIKREKDGESSSIKKEIKSESESDTESRKHKKKHKHKDRDKKRSRSRDRKLYDDLKARIKARRRHSSRDRSRSYDRDRRRDRSHSRDRLRDRSLSRDRERFRDRSRDRDRRRDRSRDRDFYRKTAYRDTKYERLERSFKQWGRDDSFYNPRPRSRSRDRSPERGRRSRDVRRRSRTRERPPREESSSRIDKKKLLEIARKNAIQMMKSGSLPGALQLGAKAQEKVIAAIKSGGKTIEELTDFCKTLSKKEELGELSSNSEREDSDVEEGAFHHPFQIKDRPTTITMNIKNSVPLPTKTTQERTTELRLQFPVSSGQQHRVTEEWIPVSPPSAKKATIEVPKPAKQVATVAPQPPLAIMPAPVEEMPPPPLPLPLPLSLPPPPPPEPPVPVMPAPLDAPGPQLFPLAAIEAAEKDKIVDIGSIVSQRLAAMKKLHENPNDVQALSQMYKVNKEMQTWAKAQEQFSQLTGAFTGSTGAQIMSQAELNSGYQAWAKKGQLTNAAPVSGGMGMHLLQKMGWKPGEGLGKEKSGTLEPLLLEVKTDKRGLVAIEEQKGKNSKKKPGIRAPIVKTLEGKHPVSLLGEYAQKRKLGAPQYIMEFECGPDHKKNFLFKVILNGVEYKPNIASINKKDAKAHAATVALKGLGLLA